MPDPVDLRFAFGLEPRRAVDYFRAKGYEITFSWEAMAADAHARAFTVAKAMNMDVLQTIHAEVDRAIAEGTTLRDFQEALQPKLETLGWWGKQVAERPDGTAQLIQAGSPRRLETIYRTNLQSAYMAGRYRDLFDNRQGRPYWQYVAVMDNRTRPAHAALNGRIFRFDDPIWESCWPPNGYNCRCRVRPLSERDMRARGLAASDSGANLKTFEDVDPSTGAVFDRVSYKAPGMPQAFSPDRGFAANQATAPFQPTLEKYDRDLQAFYIADSLKGPAFEQFMAGEGDEAFAVSRVSARLARALGVEDGGVVRLSAATRDKQIRAHAELALEDYRRLPAVIEGAEMAIRDRDTHVVLVKDLAAYWVAVVKRTGTGRAVFLQSYRRASAADVARLRSRGTVVWDDLEG